MAAKKWAKPDPYATYVDGNCRDASGQIVNCGDPSAVSPAKWDDETPSADDEDDDNEG